MRYNEGIDVMLQVKVLLIRAFVLKSKQYNSYDGGPGGGVSTIARYIQTNEGTNYKS